MSHAGLLACFLLWLPACVPQQAAAPAQVVGLSEAPGSPFSVGSNPGQPVLADFNGDGRLDLVIDVEERGKGCADLWLGDGSGRFTRRGAPTVVGGTGVKLAAPDINGDGRTDLIATQHDRYDVTVLLGDGDGKFSPATGSPVPASVGGHPHTHSLVAADMNADGAIDLLTTNADDNTVSLLLGNGTGGLVPAPGSPFAAGVHPYDGLQCVDVNADGALDVVVPNLEGNTVTVLQGGGNGGLRPAPGSPCSVGPRPGYLAAEDLDGDGDLDLVVSHDDDPILDVLLGDGRGGFHPAAGSPLRLPRTVWGVALADLSSDGRADIVLGSYQGDALVLVSSNGPAYLAKPARLAVGPSPGRVVAGDVNGDGKPDLVFSHHDSGMVSIWLHD